MKFNTECQHPNTHVVRQRGSRVRHQCDDCTVIFPWEKVNQVVVQADDDLSSLTVTDLKARCKVSGVNGYSKMTKGELITVLTAGLPTR